MEWWMTLWYTLLVVIVAFCNNANAGDRKRSTNRRLQREARPELKAGLDNQSETWRIPNDFYQNDLSISPYHSAESSEIDSLNSSGVFQHEIEAPMDLNLRTDSESIRGDIDDTTLGDRTTGTVRNEANVSNQRFNLAAENRGSIHQEVPRPELSQISLRSTLSGRPGACDFPSNCLSQVGISHTLQDQGTETCGNLLTDRVHSDNVSQAISVQTQTSEQLPLALTESTGTIMPAQDLRFMLGCLLLSFLLLLICCMNITVTITFKLF